MVSVSVCGFHDHIVRARDIGRIPDDGLLDVAQISGKDDLTCLCSFCHRQNDAGASQQVSGIHKFRRDTGIQFHHLMILAGGDGIHRSQCIRHRIQRLHRCLSGPLSLAVLPLCLLFMNVGRVLQHHPQQLRRHAGGNDFPRKPMFEQHRYPSGMIDMGMRDQDTINATGCEGEFTVGNFIPTLLQSAVNEDLFPIGFHTVAAAGDTLVCTKKADFHSIYSFPPTEDTNNHCLLCITSLFYHFSPPHSRKNTAVSCKLSLKTRFFLCIPRLDVICYFCFYMQTFPSHLTGTIQAEKGYCKQHGSFSKTLW